MKINGIYGCGGYTHESLVEEDYFRKLRSGFGCTNITSIERDFQDRARSLPNCSLQHSASDLPVNFLVSGQPLNEYRLIIYLIA